MPQSCFTRPALTITSTKWRPHGGVPFGSGASTTVSPAPSAARFVALRSVLRNSSRTVTATLACVASPVFCSRTRAVPCAASTASNCTGGSLRAAHTMARISRLHRYSQKFSFSSPRFAWSCGHSAWLT